MTSLRFRVAATFCAIFSAVTLAAQQLPPVVGGDLTEPEFNELSLKTNLYIKAINGLSRVKSSYERYRSWVDLKKGPTGKESSITYGLYTLNSSDTATIAEAAKRGPGMPPPIPQADAAVQKLAAAVTELEPLVKKASDYYRQEDFKDDGAKRGQELHTQMLPLFQAAFAAEAELRQAMEPVKARVDRRQLNQIEKTSGKNYEWHLRNFLLAAKSVVNLLPESANAPMLDAAVYKLRYAEIESAYEGFDTFSTQHPEEVKKVLLASLAESAVKDFYAASKFLRRALEGKPDKREYAKRVGETIEKYNNLIQRTNTMR